MHLSETVRKLMERDGIKGESALAKLVRAAGAVKVKPQHIQNLLRGEVEQPRYLIELARVFRISVEDLRAGRIERHPLNAGVTTDVSDRGSAFPSPSQPMGLDRSLLRQAVELLRRLELSKNEVLPPEVFADDVVVIYGTLLKALDRNSDPEGA